MLNIKFNQKVNPSVNFDGWVNDIWRTNNPIPPEYNRWGSFNILRKENENRLKKIFTNNTSFYSVNGSFNENSDFKKIKILWEQGNHMKNRNNINVLQMLKPFFDKIDNLTSKTLSRFIFDNLILFQLQSPFIVDSYTDLKNSSMNVLYASSSGLSLPDRDYYLLDNKKDTVDELKKYIGKINQNLGLNLNVTHIFSLEKEFAVFTKTKTEKRDPDRMYNPMTIDQVKQKYEMIDWDYIFKSINKKPGKIIVTDTKYFKYLNIFMKSIKIELWKDYLKWCVINSTMSYLSQDLIDIRFDFYGKTLSGTQKLKELWKRTLNQINSHLGEIVGKKYVELYFPPEAKSKALEMIGYIKNEFRKRLLNLSWMSNETKKKALQKLESFRVKIGYPEKWIDYSSLILDEKLSYLENILICRKWDSLYQINKVYKPVDKAEWHMFPQEINAYYSPTNNEIVFPAGILQPPFFSFDYDAPLNFGAIGCVIGHEMTHGFDDQGSKFDSQGNLVNWWTNEDLKLFNQKAKILEEQFSAIKIKGESVNGKLTLGENIADLGGVVISFNALKSYLETHHLEKKEGFTPLQRFFLAYARIWRNNIRDKELSNRLITDPHSPPFLRINQILFNVPEFYETFELKNNDNKKIAEIW